MNERVIAETVVEWWKDGRLVIAGRETDLLVSNGFTILKAQASDLVFTAMRLRALPSNREVWTLIGGSKEPVIRTGELLSPHKTWGDFEATPTLPLKLTPWLYQRRYGLSCVFELPDGRAIYCQKRFIDVFSERGEEEESEYSFEGVSFRGTDPEAGVIVHSAGAMVGVVMPLSAKQLAAATMAPDWPR